MRPLRILWVKMGGLWPLTSGGRLRSFHTVAQLSRRHRVTVVTTRESTEDDRSLRDQLPWCEAVIAVPVAPAKRGSPRFLSTLARSWLSSLPVDLWKWRVPAVRREVAQILKRGDVDVCVADFLVGAVNVPVDAGRTPLLLFEHNVEHMIWQRLARRERGLLRRGLLEVEWRKMRRQEIRACRRAALTLAVSEADRSLLVRAAPGAHVEAIPTGVDTDFFAPDGISESPGELVFSGSMDWYPNEDAMLYCMESILPAVRREIPGAGLTIVGRNPSNRLRRAAVAAGASVTGTVEDVRPFLARGAVYVVPLRIGGGTRLKILEALAMAKAVVATSVGAEGLPLVPGHDFIQVDEPKRFAETVVSLLRAPERRRALGASGRRLVEESFSWAQVAREFERRCAEVVRCG